MLISNHHPLKYHQYYNQIYFHTHAQILYLFPYSCLLAEHLLSFKWNVSYQDYVCCMFIRIHSEWMNSSAEQCPLSVCSLSSSNTRHKQAKDRAQGTKGLQKRARLLLSKSSAHASVNKYLKCQTVVEYVFFSY